MQICKRSPVIWDSVGKDVSGAANMRDAFVLASLDWRVSTHGVFASVEQELFPVKDMKAVVRRDDELSRKNNKEILSIVNSAAEIYQHTEILQCFNSILEDDKYSVYKAGDLNKGQKIFAIIEIKEEIIADSEIYYPFFVIYYSHDSTKRFDLIFTVLREAANTVFAFNNMQIRKADAFLRNIEPDFIKSFYEANKNSFQEKVRELAYSNISVNQANKLIDKLIAGPKMHPRTRNIKETVYQKFRKGCGNEGKTKLDFLHGVIEFVDFYRQTRVEAGKEENELRFESVIAGSGAALKKKALELL